VAALYRCSWIEAEVGVYQARCDCCNPRFGHFLKPFKINGLQ
jgi:hypothetical protein